MSYLTQAGISSLAGGFLGNYGTRGWFEGKPFVFNFIIDTFKIKGLRSSNYDKEKNGLPSPRCDMNDVIAIGVGTIAPLLISGILKTTPKDLTMFHFGTGLLISSVMTAYLEYNDKGLKKQNENSFQSISTQNI